MSKPYRPSNGTEGASFSARFCDRCAKLNLFGGCKILLNAEIYDIDDKRYPKQWVYDPKPTCTAFAETLKRKPRRHKPSTDQGKLF